jgi:hypothetical protein
MKVTNHETDGTGAALLGPNRMGAVAATDRRIRYQQNLNLRRIAFVVFLGFPIYLFSSNPHLRVIQALVAHDTFPAARFETARDEGEES